MQSLSDNTIRKEVILWSEVSNILSEVLDYDGNFDMDWFELNWSILTSNQYTFYSNLNEKTFVYLFIHTLTLIYAEFKLAYSKTSTNYSYDLVNKILLENSVEIDPSRISHISSQLKNETSELSKEIPLNEALEEVISHQKKIIHRQLTDHYKALYNLSLNTEDDGWRLVEYFVYDISKGVYRDEYTDRFFYLVNYSKDKIDKMQEDDFGLRFVEICEWFDNEFDGIEW